MHGPFPGALPLCATQSSAIVAQSNLLWSSVTRARSPPLLHWSGRGCYHKLLSMSARAAAAHLPPSASLTHCASPPFARALKLPIDHAVRPARRAQPALPRRNEHVSAFRVVVISRAQSCSPQRWQDHRFEQGHGACRTTVGLLDLTGVRSCSCCQVLHLSLSSMQL